MEADVTAPWDAPPARHYSTDPSDPVDFYGGVFSNMSPSPIVLDGLHWDTVEHFFQAQKGPRACGATPFGDELVRSAPDPWEAKRRGRSLALRPDWEHVKYDVMMRGLKAKFERPYERGVLLGTGTRWIREDSPTDFVWGWRNGGLNLLGLALMHVRLEILDLGLAAMGPGFHAFRLKAGALTPERAAPLLAQELRAGHARLRAVPEPGES